MSFSIQMRRGAVGTGMWVLVRRGALSYRGSSNWVRDLCWQGGRVSGGRLIPSCCCFSCLLAPDQNLNSSNHAKMWGFCFKAFINFTYTLVALIVFFITSKVFSFSSFLRGFIRRRLGHRIHLHFFFFPHRVGQKVFKGELIMVTNSFGGVGGSHTNMLHSLITPSDMCKNIKLFTYEHMQGSYQRPTMVSFWLDHCVLVVMRVVHQQTHVSSSQESGCRGGLAETYAVNGPPTSGKSPSTPLTCESHLTISQQKT